MVYLIDDDKSVVRAFELLLTSAEYDHRTFTSVDEFLSVFQKGTNDVLVLDLNLPGMNGCDLLKKFCQENIHIPIIVVTAFDDPNNREFCRHYGVKAYLRKPIDGEALLDIIRFNLVN